MVECSDADIFLIIPCILTKNFRMYFELEKIFEEWKKIGSQHYMYYNLL